ncbi:SIMPL domain-containing protein [Paludisphaera sp.]|uniref:SIMPL domain-containing protein n=1 Tax=Paludisphaera sp. TaxID=2017432 RepID=UPI00301C886E
MSPPRAFGNGPGPGLVLALALALAATSPRPVAAQGVRDEGLSVVGKGSARAKPTAAEIDLDVSATAELTGDAIVKFRDAVKRVRDAFAALKLPDVAIEERGPAVSQKGAAFNPYMGMDMGARAKTRTEVQLSRKLVVKVSGIESMEEEAVLQLVGRLIDVAQDAGAQVGPRVDPYTAYRYDISTNSSLVRFVVEDYDKIREEAFAKAAADARAKAERLARLNGVELGAVQSVRENADAQPQQRVYIYNFQDQSGDADEQRERLTSPKFQAVPIQVELSVRFAITPVAGAKP